MQVKNIVINKHTRSIVFLIITVIVIFAINSLLPTIEGKAHHTADAATMTYKEYKEIKDKNENYALTYSSEKELNAYIDKYLESHPEHNSNAVTIPDDFQVEVYTKFFFQHVFWYITTITRVVSAIMLFFAVFNFLLTKSKDTYKRYVDLQADMTKLCDNELDPSTFEPWMVDTFNRDRKIKQHIDNTKYKLTKLEQRTSYKIRLMAERDPDNRKCLRYIQKKEDLKRKLDPEYINDIVVHQPIKYFKYIHPTFVLCGVNNIGHTTDSYSLIQSDAARLSKDAFTKALTSTALTIMFATLLTVTAVNSADKPWYWIALDVLTTIVPLLFQIPAAFDYCNTYMEEHLITNLLNRRAIALLYLADRSKGGSYEKDSTRN